MLQKSTILLLLCVLPLGGLWGCASKYGEQTTVVNYYPQCYAPIKQLRDEENRVAKSTAGGAVGGALIGALIGGLATGKVQGAVVGGVAGGVTGGAIGYAAGKQKQIRDQNARMASYLQDLDGDIAGLDAVSASARYSIQCYDKEFNQVISAYRAGRISRLELDKSYTEIRNGIAEAERLVGATLRKAYERDEQYNEALASEAQRMGQPVPQSARSTASRSSSPKSSPSAQRPAPSNSLEAVQAKADVRQDKIDELKAQQQAIAERNKQHEAEMNQIINT